MARYGFPLLVVIVAFLLGRTSAEGDPEETTFGRLLADRITLRSDERAVVISPEGIWLETKDGRASYLEADKVALARTTPAGRRNLASLVSGVDGGAGLVFYDAEARPDMVVQNGPSGSGFVVYGADGKAVLSLQGRDGGASIELLGPGGKVLGRLATHRAPPGEPEGGPRASLVLFDSKGKLRAEIPGGQDR